jgi:hypothetical protein
MLFSERIPEVLREAPNTSKLVKVLDEMQLYKDSEIYKSSRFYNPVLLTNKKFLIRLIEEWGYPAVPQDFPKEILDNMYLNAENVFRLKGSKVGLEYFFRVMTCGEPTINDTLFFPEPEYIIPGDPIAGYTFTTTDFPNDILYLFSGTDSFRPRSLTISVATPYYNLTSLVDYLNKNIYKFIGYVDLNTTVTITLVNGPYVPNPLANQFYVNP